MRQTKIRNNIDLIYKSILSRNDDAQQTPDTVGLSLGAHGVGEEIFVCEAYASLQLRSVGPAQTRGLAHVEQVARGAVGFGLSLIHI